MNRKFLFLCFLFLFILNNANAQYRNIDLSNQGRDESPSQITGTCANHSTTDILEMALNRSNKDKPKVELDFNEVQAAQFLNESDNFFSNGDDSLIRDRAEKFMAGQKSNYLDGSWGDDSMRGALQHQNFSVGQNSFNNGETTTPDWLTEAANSTMKDYGAKNGQAQIKKLIETTQTARSSKPMISTAQIKLDPRAPQEKDLLGISAREIQKLSQQERDKIIADTKDERQKNVQDYITNRLDEGIPVYIGFQRDNAELKELKADGSMRALHSLGGHAAVVSGMKEVNGEWYYVLRDPNREIFQSLNFPLEGNYSPPPDVFGEVLLPIKNSHAIGQTSAYLAPGDKGYDQGVRPPPLNSSSPQPIPQPSYVKESTIPKPSANPIYDSNTPVSNPTHDNNSKPMTIPQPWE